MRIYITLQTREFQAGHTCLKTALKPRLKGMPPKLEIQFANNLYRQLIIIMPFFILPT